MAKLTVKELEEEMDEIRMLMKIWNNFYRILTSTFYDENVDIEKLDPEFQQIKQIIAEHHGHFMKVIKKDFHIGQSVLTTVKRTITLEGFHNLSHLEINKTLIEWHDANILLNETLGSLECERDKILRGRVQKVQKEKKKTKLLDPDRIKTVVILLVVVGIVVAVAMYWETIHSTSYYQNYMKSWLDPLLQSVGVPIPEEAAAG